MEKKENKKDDDEVGNGAINPLKKYVILRNVCQNIDIDVIITTKAGRDDILPIDVPMSYALDCGSDSDLGTSVQIRLMMDHYFAANNELLRKVHQVDDNNVLKEKLGGFMTNLQISKRSDVVDIEEQMLKKLLQQCYQQRCRYGLDENEKNDKNGDEKKNEKNEQDKVDVGKLLNLPLLESRLRERYIAGRKIIEYNTVKYEFAGQSNIPQAITMIEHISAQINKDRNVNNVSYFTDAPIEYLERIKEETVGKLEMNLNVNNNDDDGVNNKNNLKKAKMESIRKCKQSVEQTIIALSNKSQSMLPDGSIEIGKYMDHSLHLFKQEYEAFTRVKFELKHLDSLWNYLNRLYLLEEGKWQEIPTNILDIYLKPLINEEDKKLIQQFIQKEELHGLWKFLTAFREFLQQHCGSELPGFKPPKTDPSLVMYLANAEGIDEDLIYQWPDKIPLSHCGYAYRVAAKFYGERVEREERDEQKR